MRQFTSDNHVCVSTGILISQKSMDFDAMRDFALIPRRPAEVEVSGAYLYASLV